MTFFSLPNRLLFTLLFTLPVISLIIFGGMSSEIKAQSKNDFSASEYDKDGVPVLLKNLPDWQNVIEKAAWIESREALISAVGNRSVLDSVDFSKALEAVVAEYPEGKLLVLEYGTPQLSAAADAQFKQALTASANPSDVIYRRIGNYNAFIFDPSDKESANQLLDKIYYGKVVQWLGEDPKLAEKLENYWASTTAQVFISTALVIVIGLGIALTLGVSAGLLFFRHRQKQRDKLKTFSDAGGMIRINLDGFSDQPGRDD